jgi:hypothetical protein
LRLLAADQLKIPTARAFVQVREIVSPAFPLFRFLLLFPNPCLLPIISFVVIREIGVSPSRFPAILDPPSSF